MLKTLYVLFLLVKGGDRELLEFKNFYYFRDTIYY